MEWPHILAYITGTVDQELLLRNEYLATENRILRGQIKVRLLLSDSEKKTLAEIGYRLAAQSLEDVANAAKPDTILGWYRKLVAQKFDGSKLRQSPGRPRIEAEIERLIVCMAKENPSWGYDRIVGATWLLSPPGCQTKPWDTSCGVMEYALPRRGSTRRHGQRSFVRTWRSSQEPTSSVWRSSPSWMGDLLCFVPHPHRKPQGIHRSDHRPSD